MGSKRIPVRRCVSCRSLYPRDQLWRIVRLAKNHTVQLDTGMGRSAYLCCQSQCLQEAQKKNRLSRALRTSVPPSIYQDLWQRLSPLEDAEDLMA